MFDRKLVKPTAPLWTAQSPDSETSPPTTADIEEPMTKYDVAKVHDPLARPSKHFNRTDAACTCMANAGDHQIWIEKVLMSTKSCEPRSFFVSERTELKVPDEPPTGASRVLYLRDSFREQQKSEIRKNGKRLLTKFRRYRKENRTEKQK